MNWIEFRLIGGKRRNLAIKRVCPRASERSLARTHSALISIVSHRRGHNLCDQLELCHRRGRRRRRCCCFASIMEHSTIQCMKCHSSSSTCVVIVIYNKCCLNYLSLIVYFKLFSLSLSLVLLRWLCSAWDEYGSSTHTHNRMSKWQKTDNARFDKSALGVIIYKRIKVNRNVLAVQSPMCIARNCNIYALRASVSVCVCVTRQAVAKLPAINGKHQCNVSNCGLSSEKVLVDWHDNWQTDKRRQTVCKLPIDSIVIIEAAIRRPFARRRRRQWWYSTTTAQAAVAVAYIYLQLVRRRKEKH